MFTCFITFSNTQSSTGYDGMIFFPDLDKGQ